MKRVIFHINMQVWLSESPEHQTEESCNLYYRDCGSQRPITGYTVHFGWTGPPIVNAISNSNTIVEVHVLNSTHHIQLYFSASSPPVLVSLLQLSGSGRLLQGWALQRVPIPGMPRLGYCTSKWVPPGSGPGVTAALSVACIHCAATMKNWVSKKARKGFQAFAYVLEEFRFTFLLV